jgi:hypothetical protein
MGSPFLPRAHRPRGGRVVLLALPAALFGLVVCDKSPDAAGPSVTCGKGTKLDGTTCVLVAGSGGSTSSVTSGTGGAGGKALSCGPGTIENSGQCVPEPVPPTKPSVADMVARACSAGTCRASDVVNYWSKVIANPPYDETTWEDHAVRRTVTFKDDGTPGSKYAFEVTDTTTKQPAKLEFEVGVPVILTLVNPSTGANMKHNFSSPAFFRAVAWRQATTSQAKYKAPAFDDFQVMWTATGTHRMDLEFVPIVAGNYTAYCSISMTNGGQYKAIADGKTMPDLNSGHAGLGMHGSVTVTDPLSLKLKVFQEALARPVADDDPRRSGSNAAWAGLKGADGVPCTMDAGETVPCPLVTFTELSDQQYAMSPATLPLTANLGYVVRLVNPPNQVDHSWAGPHMFKDFVMQRAEDAEGGLRAPYLHSIQIAKTTTAAAEADVHVIPTVKTSYLPYCEIGVKLGMDGVPDMATGHAGSGMLMTLNVQ